MQTDNVAMFSKKSALLFAALAMVAFLLYEPMPQDVADPLTIWLTAKIRDLVRTFNRIRGRAEFEMDLLEALHSPVGDDPDIKVYDHLDGPVKLRVYEPRRRTSGVPGPAVIFVHGGGFVLGSTLSYDLTVLNLAKRLQMIVFSVEYRKAPRFVFPAQIEDVEAATHYVIDNASFFRIDSKRVGLMGDSAGGALTATVAIKMRPTDPARRHPLALIVLIYPGVQCFNFQSPAYYAPSTQSFLRALDVGKFLSLYLTGSDRHASTIIGNMHTSPETKRGPGRIAFKTSSIPENLRPKTFSPPSMDVGSDVEELRAVTDWRVSPLIADLSHLPKTMVVAAQHDILRDDSFLFHDRLKESGVESTLKFYPRAYHGIIWLSNMIPRSDLAHQILDDVSNYIIERL